MPLTFLYQFLIREVFGLNVIHTFWTCKSYLQQWPVVCPMVCYSLEILVKCMVNMDFRPLVIKQLSSLMAIAPDKRQKMEGWMVTFFFFKWLKSLLFSPHSVFPGSLALTDVCLRWSGPPRHSQSILGNRPQSVLFPLWYPSFTQKCSTSRLPFGQWDKNKSRLGLFCIHPVNHSLLTL